jgi:hypothetical protein
MTTHMLQFVELSERERKTAQPLGKFGKGVQVEVRVRRRSGKDQVVKLSAQATTLLESAFGRVLKGERIAVLAEDQELSPNDAADILGIFRPLVVHRMDIGDLPFRYVGKHGRTKLKDVPALKTKLDTQHAAIEALTEMPRISGGDMAFEASVAVFGACILYPIHLRNIFIQMAVDRLVEAR